MPRQKKYTSKAAQQQAQREKSHRYYQRHRQTILDRKRHVDREAALLKRQEARLSEYRERKSHAEKRLVSLKLKRERELRQAQMISASGSAIHQMRNLENDFNRQTSNSPSAHLDGICNEVLKWYSTSPRPTQSPFSPHYQFFETLRDSIDKVANRMVKEPGGQEVAAEWRHANLLQKRIGRVCQCLDSIHSAVVDDDLLVQYASRSLLHQDTVCRSWLDGERGYTTQDLI
ncbi:hypothetical protein VNI00_014361 [Paramarasmius palmivorus]|uniref:Uncharacterized protein n=1 Tax=Paramarasmius palmivorus TaxID=297713 RepID=A0AAW0BRJ2_9AGAR